MAINNFIPALWAGEVLRNLNNTSVYASVCNRNYEGQINAQGDSVRINSIGAVTVGDYTKNSDMSAPQTLSDAQQTLLIDKAKYFNFQVDDIDAAQQNPKIMQDAMAEAAYALRNTQDGLIAAVHTDAASANLLGSDGSPHTVGTGGGETAAYTELVSASVLMDNANVPPDGRWIIVPPWFHGLLLLDERFVSFGTDPNGNTLRNGRVGRAAGFDIMTSNNVANTAATKYKVMFGHPMAITLAEQIVSTEAYRPQLRFADAVKGLHVYGFKVIRPSALGVATCNKGTGAV